MDRSSSLLAVFALALAFAAALGFSGCNQGAGERCEVDRDCQSGLLCGQKSADSSGGICILPNSNDSGTPVDSPAEVASSDLPTERATDLATDGTSDLPAETAAEAAPETPDAAVETAEDAPVDGAADAGTVETGG